MGNELSSEPWRSVLIAIEQENCNRARARRLRRSRVSSTPRHRIGNIKRTRVYTQATLMPVAIFERTDVEFKRMFRMSRSSFEKLYDLVHPYIPDVDISMATRSSGTTISKRSKLLCCLRFLAGASYLDLITIFNCSHPSLYSTDINKGMVWPVIDAINACNQLQIGLPINDPAKMTETANGFAQYVDGAMYGCVSAIDGWVCRIRKPTAEEAPDRNVRNFMNRSGEWSLVVIAGCDSRLRFNIFSAMNSGSTNDALAWSWCPARDIVEGEEWPSPYYTVGDEAFVNTNRFLVPYAGRNLSQDRDSFNWCLSKMRQCIERAFGLMVERWGILWRPLRVRFNCMPKLLMCVARLHNYCIDCNDNHIPKRDSRDVLPDDLFQVIINLQHLEDGIEAGGATGYALRRSLTQDIWNRGIRRPPSNLNSRMS